MNKKYENTIKPLKFNLQKDHFVILDECKNPIVSFERSSDNKSIKVTENCDGYFSVDLDKDEIHELISLLIILKDELEEVEHEIIP